MIQSNGQNGNGSAAMIEEPAARGTVIAVPTAVQEQEPELPTRTKQRARQQFHQNRFVIIGAGAIVLALLGNIALGLVSAHLLSYVDAQQASSSKIQRCSCRQAGRTVGRQRHAWG